MQKELEKRSNFDFVSDEKANNRIEEIKAILEQSEISEDEYVNIIYTYEIFLEFLKLWIKFLEDHKKSNKMNILIIELLNRLFFILYRH